MKLSTAERSELWRLRAGPCGYYGASTIRLHNALSKRGLARLGEGGTSITDTGRASLDLPTLSIAQWQMVESIAKCGDAFVHLRGRSAHGGAAMTHAALVRAKIIDMQSVLTDAGRAALAAKRWLDKEEKR